jgi:hypothetical protein
VTGRNDIDCPRARSWMTPCIARDGASALDDHHAPTPKCVGCGAEPRALLLDLAERYPPARRHRQAHDPRTCADALTKLVREYVNRTES